MPRTKCLINRQVKGFIEYELQNYHTYKAQIAAFRASLMPSMTPAYNESTGGGSSESRQTESIAVRLTEDVYMLHMMRTVEVIDADISKLNHADKKLIEIVYWKRDYTVDGAARKVGYSAATAYRHINYFILALARSMGYIEK